MDLFAKNKKNSRLLFMLFILLAILIYLPAFLSTFGLHTDYSLILKDKNRDILEYIETKYTILLGRYLGAYLQSFLYQVTTCVSSISLERLFFFVCFMALCAWMVSFLRRKCRLDYFWTFAIVMMFFCLPGSQLSILWVSYSVYGCLNLLFCFATFYVLDASRNATTKVGRMLMVHLAGLMLTATLFVYQPSALFITVLVTAQILFDPGSWRKIRRFAIEDSVVISLSMIAYFMIDRFIVHPLMLSTGQYTEPTQSAYQMQLLNNVFEKIPLLKEALAVSLAGPLHLLVGNTASLIIIGLFALILVMILKDPQANALNPKITLQKTLLIATLFFLSLAPILLPSGYTELTGYRVIHVSSMLIILWIFSLMIHLHKTTSSARTQMIVKTLVLTWIGVSVITTATNVREVARNASLELSLVHQSLDQAPAGVELYLLNPVPAGMTLTGFPLKYEFAYMLTTYHQLIPIISEYWTRQKIQANFKVGVLDHNQDNPWPDVMHIIDLKSLTPVQ